MNIKQFWKAVLAQDEEEIRKYFHKDAYVNWHCTNEHFTVDEYIIANCEYPGEWDGIIERTEMVNELISALTTIAGVEPTMRKRGSIFRTLSIGIGYQAQTVVRTQIDRDYNQ